MIYKLFDMIYREAKEYKSEEMYIMERGWQIWMNDYTAENISNILREVWSLAKSDIKQLRKKAKLNMRGFSAKFGIPYNTALKWESEGKNHREPPEYLIEMIAFVLFEDWLNKNKRPETREYFGENEKK